jgi:AcrR family transcriptional regulator
VTADNGPVRERVLGAAADLFYRDGVRAVGVDALIVAAGVARASFYRHFPSKDALVAAWLRSSRARWLDRVRPEVERRATTSHDQVVLFFEVLAEMVAEPGYRGCPYLNTAAEFPNPAPEVRAAIVDYLHEAEEYLCSLAIAGSPEPCARGRALWLLTAGTLAVAHPTADPSVGPAALEAARLLVTAAR